MILKNNKGNKIFTISGDISLSEFIEMCVLLFPDELDTIIIEQDTEKKYEYNPHFLMTCTITCLDCYGGISTTLLNDK